MELDTGQGCVSVSEKHEIIGMAGVNYLPLESNGDGTFNVLLCRLDGLSINRHMTHYQADDCIGDHMKLIYGKTPIGEYNGSDRIKAMLGLNKGIDITKVIRDVNFHNCGFNLLDVKIDNGLVFGLVEPIRNEVMANRTGIIDGQKSLGLYKAIVFTWRVLNKQSMLDGIVYEDIVELVNYDCAFLSERGIEFRRKQVGK